MVRGVVHGVRSWVSELRMAKGLSFLYMGLLYPPREFEDGELLMHMTIYDALFVGDL